MRDNYYLKTSALGCSKLSLNLTMIKYNESHGSCENFFANLLEALPISNLLILD